MDILAQSAQESGAKTAIIEIIKKIYTSVEKKLANGALTRSDQINLRERLNWALSDYLKNEPIEESEPITDQTGFGGVNGWFKESFDELDELIDSIKS